jgi:hypothetical protein
MTGTFVQPDFETQKGNGTTYVTNLDGSIAAMKGVGAAFACHETATPDMEVVVDAGTITDASDGSLISVAQTSLGPLTAPSVEPRYDIVYVAMADGTLGVETGAEAASPSDPAIPAGAWALARVRLETSTTAIPNTSIDDLRTWAVKTDVTALAGLTTEIAALGSGDALAGLQTVGAAGGVYLDIPMQAGYSATMTGVNIEARDYYEIKIPRAFSATGEVASCGTAPTGADLIFDIEKNGTTIYTTKPQIAAGATTLTAGTLKTDGTEDFAAGDVLTFGVTQIGSTIPGQKALFTLKGLYA